MRTFEHEFESVSGPVSEGQLNERLDARSSLGWEMVGFTVQQPVARYCPYGNYLLVWKRPTDT